MEADDIKKAEHRAYARGYATGRKKAKIERSADQVRKERQAFLDKAFLAALPVCIDRQIKAKGTEGINDNERKVTAAWWYAQESLKQRRSP